jgi:hypothetical protein
LVLLVLWVGLALVGWDFYGHDLDARLDHPAYELLRPSGLVGHGYGIVGTALILSNLLYLARRRFARAQLGSMRLWLDIHVFSGLAGGALVLFHSAFQFRTGIALMTGREPHPRGLDGARGALPLRAQPRGRHAAVHRR